MGIVMQKRKLGDELTVSALGLGRMGMSVVSAGQGYPATAMRFVIG
jgi:aryl-alcohol dehydrogenase-like predicted oxidoreductase